MTSVSIYCLAGCIHLLRDRDGPEIALNNSVYPMPPHDSKLLNPTRRHAEEPSQRAEQGAV